MQFRLIPRFACAALLAACEPSGPRDLAGLETGAASLAISGQAAVVDGDSLEIGGISIRIFGVDAFEGRQACTRDGKAWACGEAASRKLAELVSGVAIVCEPRDIDRYGRTVARCLNGKVDLAAELALAGLALAYREYSTDYVDEESEATSERRGAWAGEFVSPWDWRSDGEDGALYPAPPADPPNDLPLSADCLIKGNINRDDERIYHVPGSSYYDATLIDESAGERWFCSEAEAIAVGWRKSRAR